MEVILLDHIDGLGRKGAVVRVRPGYARNYLLPSRKALLATKDTLFRLGSLKKQFLEEETKLLSELGVVAKQLQGMVLSLEQKANPEGHLYGSVSAQILARAIAERGLKIEDRMVKLGEPIKAVGTYPVRVRLHPDVEVDIQVVVTAEGAPAEPAPAEPAAADAPVPASDAV